MSATAHLAGLAIAAGPDFYKTPRLVECHSGKLVRFQARLVPGRGWTVAMVVGSKRSGRHIERAKGFADSDSYTMHQAQRAADDLTRDTFRALAARPV